MESSRPAVCRQPALAPKPEQPAGRARRTRPDRHHAYVSERIAQTVETRLLRTPVSLPQGRRIMENHGRCAIEREGQRSRVCGIRCFFTSLPYRERWNSSKLCLNDVVPYNVSLTRARG